MTEKEKMINGLIEKACEARTYAYCPYSGFAVGAALLGKNGVIYTGCNIENASFTPTNCAERTAVFKAVSEGMLEFEMIVITGGKKGEEPSDYCPPCGVCRQVLSEFCSEDFPVILAKKPGDYLETTLGELFARMFHLQS